LGSLLVRRRDGPDSLKDLLTRIPVIVSWDLTSRPPAMTSNLFLFPNVTITGGGTPYGAWICSLSLGLIRLLLTSAT